MLGLNPVLHLLRETKKTSNVIILGTDYPEFKLCKTLTSEGDKVHFFISEDPWKYNTQIEGVACRYPKELTTLCENYQIDYVYYCDPIWPNKILDLPKGTKIIPFTQ